MYTIKYSCNNEIIVKKSEFIAYLFHVTNKEEINIFINELKEKYHDCNHVCFAYILDNEQKCSDDNEPSGTAGMPILNVLTKKHLTNVLCIVIRYFGGIKLGASNLLRTYSKSASEVIKISNIIKYKKTIKCSIRFNYHLLKTVNNIIKDEELINKKYDNNIIYYLNIDEKNYNNIEQQLNSLLIELKKEK